MTTKKYVFEIIVSGYGDCPENAFYDALETLGDEGLMEFDNTDIISEENAPYMDVPLQNPVS